MASIGENLIIIKGILEEEKAQYGFISDNSGEKRYWLPRYEKALKALNEISAENIHLIRRVLQSPNSIPIVNSQPWIKSVRGSCLMARQPALKALEEIEQLFLTPV
jgi:hypothetical protein